jgi:hypothetical protein
MCEDNITDGSFLISRSRSSVSLPEIQQIINNEKSLSNNICEERFHTIVILMRKNQDN